MPEPSENPMPRLHWSITLALLATLSVLSIWSWQKWETVWVERSEAFFPPEFQHQDVESLAWKYPIYRSNDTYQWVYLADSLAEGNSAVLRHRTDEGPQTGRENAWNSILPRILHLTGAGYAKFKGVSTQHGIHFVAHWLAPVIFLIAIGAGMTLISQLSDVKSAAFFGILYFFNAAISWDFSFSRLDHESLFQLCFLFQILGIAGILQRKDLAEKRWIILAGLGTAGCWWISSTVQMAVSVFIMLGCIVAGLTAKNLHPKHASGFLTFGYICAAGILVACAIEGRSPLEPSLSALHPLFALTQLGACAVSAAAMHPTRKNQLILFGLGLIAGMSPLLWLGVHQEAAHTWFDPLIRRVHTHIVEFQSPLNNGTWNTALFAQSGLALACLTALLPWKHRIGRVLFLATLCLLVLALLQSRWLGLLASLSTIAICLSIHVKHHFRYIATLLAVILIGTWVVHWNRIGSKPGIQFVTDMFLQAGSRDLNLNLRQLAGESATNVAIPYAFAANSALFDEVRPLGTLYWENRDGIHASALLFATGDDNVAKEITDQHGIQYLAVQPNELGVLFVNMVTWTALEKNDLATTEASLAWRLSTGKNIPEWCTPLPFYGTFDPARFSMRIYKVER